MHKTKMNIFSVKMVNKFFYRERKFYSNTVLLSKYWWFFLYITIWYSCKFKHFLWNTILAPGSFLDTFQKIADAITNAKFWTHSFGIRHVQHWKRIIIVEGRKSISNAKSHLFMSFISRLLKLSHSPPEKLVLASPE